MRQRKPLPIFIVLLTICLTFLWSVLCDAIWGVSPADPFSFSDQKSDFQFYDWYTKISARQSKKSVCDDIVVVSVDNCPRSRFGELIDSLGSKGAKVVGVDILFLTKTEEDLPLISALNNSPIPIVLPSTLRPSDEDPDTYYLQAESYFRSGIGNYNISDGAVNVEGLNPSYKIRSFLPFFYGEDFSCMNQFGAEVVRLFSYEKYDTLMKMDRGTLPINYSLVLPTDRGWHEVLDGTVDVRDKIVLLGFLNDLNDAKLTPMGDVWPGVMIHAQIAATILSGSYITYSPKWINVLVALVFCSLFVAFSQRASKRRQAGNLLCRLMQISLLGIFALIGNWVFLHHLCYFDIFYIISSLSLAALFLDIVRGSYSMIDWFHRKKSNP